MNQPWWEDRQGKQSMFKRDRRSTSPYLDMVRHLQSILNHLEEGNTDVYNAQDIAAFRYMTL